AQFGQETPGFFAQQSQDNLAVRIGGVVVWNFTQAGSRVLRGLRGKHLAGEGGVPVCCGDPKYGRRQGKPWQFNLLRFCRGKTTVMRRSSWRSVGTSRWPYK